MLFFTIYNMPQLVPFYFVNEILFSFSLLGILLYVLSKYILPRILNLFNSRIYISNLLKTK